MIFWAGILAGGFFIWFAIRIGFYETWTLLFNVVISIYLAIFLTPVMIDNIPAAGELPCCEAFMLLALSVGTFLILYGISYVFLTGQYKVSFPKSFDILFAGALGFLTGFLVLSFAALIITISPIARNRIISGLGFNRQSQRANIAYICRWCDLVNSIVSFPDKKITTEQTINQLIDSVQSRKTNEKTGLNEPGEPNDLNQPEDNGIEQNI